MALSPNQHTVIARASRTAVQAEFANIAANWSNSRWLCVQNRYQTACIDRLNKDIGNNWGLRCNKHLRKYIAASSITHCLDGWSFLGSAIDAHLKGDGNTSRHLGYYAELRAAMALLAAEGIGVFDNYHFIVTNNSHNSIEIAAKDPTKPNAWQQRTHRFTWEALEYWADLPAVDLIFDIIEPGGIQLKEWLSHFSILGGFRSIIAKKWLSSWGLDLRRFTEDRDARNLASYRPTAFISSPAMNVNEVIRFASEFWEICEPADSLQFPKLDGYLLRQSLGLAFRSAHAPNRTNKQAKALYESLVGSMLRHLPLTDLARENWEEFLSYEKLETLPLILQEAKDEDVPSHPRHHIQVLSRATLLLRLASGACHRILESLTDFSRDDLEFWWSTIGRDRALWHTEYEYDNFGDLWADVDDAITELQQWQGSSDMSYFRLWEDYSRSAGILGTCERIALWGLGL